MKPVFLFLLSSFCLYLSGSVTQSHAHLIPFGFWKGGCKFVGTLTINSSNVADYTGCSWHLYPSANLTIDLNAPINIKDLLMEGGAVLTHSVCTTTVCTQVNLNASGNVIVKAGASITADGKGYLGGRQGANNSNRGRFRGNINTNGPSGGAGGSHASSGSGGYIVPCYGDVYAPVDYGGGGGANTAANPGGNGGGVIRIISGGEMIVNGVISANGASAATGKSNVGGGAGGSIWLTAEKFTSNATAPILQAYGGGGDPGQVNTSSGGGGRIALYYGTLGGTMAFNENFIQTTTTSVTSSTGPGPHGTFLARQTGQTYGDLYIIGNGNGAWGYTPIGVSGYVSALSSTTVNYANAGSVSHLLAAGELVGKEVVVNIMSLDPVKHTISANDGTTGITVSSGDPSAVGKVNSLWFIDDYQNHFDNVMITRDADVSLMKIKVEGTLTVDKYSVLRAVNIHAGNLVISRNTYLFTRGDGNDVFYTPLHIVGNNMTVDNTSVVYLMRAGYIGGGSWNGYTGATNGFTTTGGAGEHAGGSHGGYGGVNSTTPSFVSAVPYGSLTQPSLPGGGGGGDSASGNNGAWGGGVLRIELTGALTNDGSFDMRGGYVTADNVGTGAGGSIWITADTIGNTGSNWGDFSATGGYTLNNPGASAGGGGRIALYYRAFTGTMALNHFYASGGYSSSGYWGGPGTVYAKTTAAAYGDLYFDNFDNAGNYLQTPFPQEAGNQTFANIFVRGKSSVKMLSTASSISATNTTVSGAGSILYIPTNGGPGYGVWFNPGTVSTTSGGAITEY